MAVLAIAGLHGLRQYSFAICPKRMYDFPYVKNTSRRLCRWMQWRRNWFGMRRFSVFGEAINRTLYRSNRYQTVTRIVTSASTGNRQQLTDLRTAFYSLDHRILHNDERFESRYLCPEHGTLKTSRYERSQLQGFALPEKELPDRFGSGPDHVPRDGRPIDGSVQQQAHLYPRVVECPRAASQRPRAAKPWRPMRGSRSCCSESMRPSRASRPAREGSMPRRSNASIRAAWRPA